MLDHVVRLILHYLEENKCATLSQLDHYVNEFTRNAHRDTIKKYVATLTDAGLLNVYKIVRYNVYCLAGTPRRRAVELLLLSLNIPYRAVYEDLQNIAYSTKSKRIWISRDRLLRRYEHFINARRLSIARAVAFEYVKEIVPHGELVVVSKNRIYYVIDRAKVISTLKQYA
jgi:L-lactate utilization protein LutB